MILIYSAIPIPRLTDKALSTLIMSVSSRIPIFSRSLFLSSVRTCSSKTIESFASPQPSALTLICVGRLVLNLWLVIAAAITSQINKAKMPTHIELSASEYGLYKDSVILLEQIRTIDKKRLREKVAHLDKKLMKTVDDALSVSFGLENI